MKNKENIDAIERPETINSAKKQLEAAIDEYLQWMATQGYSKYLVNKQSNILNQFLFFVKERSFSWSKIFTLDTLESFQKTTGTTWAYGIRGLSRYLFQQKRITTPIKKTDYKLPDIYEEYLSYYQKSRHADNKQIEHIRRVLFAFYDYLEKLRLNFSSITIELIDSFFAEFNSGFAPKTCQQYMYYLRGFFRYLYYERRILKKDFAPLIVFAPIFTHSKPPKFLRPHEIQKLFESIDLSTPKGLRAYAMLKLAHSLGLRPREISELTLDDIEFSKGEISIEKRKADNPIKLPLPEDVIKAIATYVIAGRPKTMHRSLFLSLQVPYRPVTANSISGYIIYLMRKNNLNASTYWLRHAYGQSLLESGASIYEIKEMMGHDSIESTKQYLHIHTKLMSEVLLDE